MDTISLKCEFRETKLPKHCWGKWDINPHKTYQRRRCERCGYWQEEEMENKKYL